MFLIRILLEQKDQSVLLGLSIYIWWSWWGFFVSLWQCARESIGAKGKGMSENGEGKGKGKGGKNASNRQGGWFFFFFCNLKQCQTYNDNDPKHVIVIVFFVRYVTLLHPSIDVITICEILCQLCLPVVGLSKTLDIKNVDLWSWRHSQRHPSPVGRTGHLSKWPNHFRLLKYFMRLPRIDMKATKFGFVEKSKIQKNRRQMEQRIAGIVCATHLSVHPTLIWFRKNRQVRQGRGSCRDKPSEWAKNVGKPEAW